jgi:S-adenosylmethionine hydrolase
LTPSSVITLLTDFGNEDAYVASMKGVILGRAPDLRVVDITHQVPAQDLRRGGFVLAEAVPFFPAGTVHIVVVDPGVGTERAALVAEVDDQIIVAPDNGVISELLERASSWRCFSLDRLELGLEKLSSTFHGRDLFAPVGALLAAGELRAEDCGPAIEPIWIRRPAVLLGENSVMGSVVTIDHFGNFITDIRREHLPESWPKGVDVAIGDREVDACVETYGRSEVGSLVALVGSGDFLEIARVDGNAAIFLDQRVGTRVHIRW